MKYYLKSDYFRYVHPSMSPHLLNESNVKELEEAIANTALFKYNKELFDTAVYESDGTISRSQIGTIVLFPEISPTELPVMQDFISKVFGKAESELGKDYNEADDPTIFWETGINGRHFGGKAKNPRTGETFGANSPSIYMAGCKDTTADYLVEVAVDQMYLQSSKHDKRCKDGEDHLNFSRYRTFLVYSVGSKRFYELGTHDRDLYHAPQRRVVRMPIPEIEFPAPENAHRC